MNSLSSWIEQHATQVVASLAAIDFITLIIAVVLALNQNAATQEAVNKGCQNSGAIIAQNRQQLVLANRGTYQKLIPGLTDEGARQLVDLTRRQAHATIDRLSQGCTDEQLRSPHIDAP